MSLIHTCVQIDFHLHITEREHGVGAAVLCYKIYPLGGATSLSDVRMRVAILEQERLVEVRKMFINLKILRKVHLY